MSNQRLDLGARLQGSPPFLEIQSFNSDNFQFDANSQVNLADSLSVENLTINGTFTNAGGGEIGGSSATYTTSITTPKIIFTDNLSEGLTIESSDGADYITFDSTNGTEHIDILKDVNTGGNKITMGTNGSRGIIQYGNIKNSTIDNTNTLSANTTGTASAWTSNMTLNLANAYTGSLASSVAFNGSSTAQLDLKYIDESSSASHRFVLQNTESSHTSANLQTRIEFLNQHQSGMVRSDNKVVSQIASSGQFSTVVYDTGHASNFSELRLLVDYPDDIPSFNNFVFWDTLRDGERFMKLVNLSTTYDSTTAQKQYPTSIHFGNGGDFSDTVVGNTFAKIKANWRADGQGQLRLLARRTASSSAQECGLLITDNAGSNAIQQNQQTNNMIISGQQIDGFSDIKYFNGCALGNSSHLGNGLEYKNSGGTVISGASTGYDNTLELKLKSGGGLTADSDGLYFSGSAGEWSAGSGTEIVASPHKVIGLLTENLTASKLTGFGGTDSTLKSSFNHIFGRMDNDNTDVVDGGITIVGYNEGTGNNVGGHSQLVLHNAHTESTDGLCEEIAVFRLENEGDCVIQMAKNQQTNTDQIYNGANGVVYDKMKFYREGGVLTQLSAFNGTDNVLANWNTNRARNATTKGDHTFTLYNHGDNMLFEMICGNNNLTSGTDVGGSSVSTPSGFQIEHEDGGDTRFNNNKTKALIFEITGSEKMRVHDNGNVGIGTNNPKGALHIVGGPVNIFAPTGVYVWGAAYLHNGGVASSWPGMAGTQNTYGAATGLVVEHNVMAGVYHTFSDRRLKTDIEDVPDNLALEQVNNLQCKYYNYKDFTKTRENKVIGFIAQEVKEIIPNAVSLTTDFIPDEMRIVEAVWEDNKLIIDLDLSGNHTGNCRFYLSDDISGNDECMKEVKYENGGFVFDKQYLNVFFWGKEVNDFHTIDKNMIFTLHHSAIQELDKKNDLLMLENNGLLERTQVLEDKNTELENKVNILETENNSLLVRTQEAEDKISSLESLIQDLTRRVAINETTLHGLIN